MFFIIMGLMFFLPAGTFKYCEAWIYLAILGIPMILVMLYLIRYDPELLERRMKMKEKEKEQKLIIKFGSLIFIIIYLIPGFDKRFGWSSVPMKIILTADVLVLIGYLLFVRVLMENSYASRIVEVEKDQQVITTGPYKFVRHPMYTAILLMYILGPLALGSAWGMIGSMMLIIVLVVRILSEEKILLRDLKGYPEYLEKTRYRLIPGIW
ncbi:isoprenylcysteine carboxylmethyltransferase family protein [candidate division KSB1 bacterium]|nr:isoprenylcysteine carboxylmethyltransferase family protein [candidate division KSB1 bacterium]